MELLLVQDVEKLGKAGEVVTVREGYARNYLVPQGLARAATPENLKWLEKERARETDRKAKEAAAHREIGEKISGKSVTIAAKAVDKENLYGSVTAAMIAAALEKEGVKIEPRHLLLAEPIRKVGTHQVPFKLPPDVEGEIKVWVVAE